MNPSATISNDQPIVRASKRKSSTKKTGAVKKACLDVEVSTSTGKKPQKKRDRFYQRPGTQLSLRCEPVEIFEEALVKLKEKLPEDSDVRCEEGGVVSITFSSMFRKNCDVINSEKWKWVQERETGWLKNPSEKYIEKMMTHLKLTDREGKMMPIITWLYSFHGRHSFINPSKRVFLIFTASTLHKLRLCETTAVTRTFERMEKLDKEHIFIRDYKEMVDRTEIPGVENSAVFNVLRYSPGTKKVLLVEQGYIMKAMSNFTSEVARSLADIASKVCEYVMREAAQSHAEAVGEEEFERTVVAPAQEDLKLQIARLAAEKKASLDQIQKLRYDLAFSGIEKVKLAERCAKMETQNLTAAYEAAKQERDMIVERYESAILLNKVIEEKEDEIRGKELILFEKDMMESKFNRHLELNLPIRPIGSRMDVNQHEHRGAVIVYSTNQRPQENIKLEEGEELLQIKFITRTDFNKKKQDPLQKIVTSLIGSAKDFSLYKNQGVENIKKVHLILFGGIENLQTRTIFRDEIIQRAVEAKQSARFNSVGIVNSSSTEDVINRLMRERLPLLFVAGFSTNDHSFINQDMGETSYTREDMDYINAFDFHKFCARASYASE